MSELTDRDVDRLVDAAAAVRLRAHAPYSSFAVGAAVLDSEGAIHVGCNVENASYGLGVCAERNAIAAAVAAGGSALTGIAVVTGISPPASPCGACRQVLAEFGDYTVILANLSGKRVVTRVSELLPNAFSAESLTQGEG
jgi:cytidine deaminase